MERSVYMLSVVKLKGLGNSYANLRFLQNFFLRVLFKMEDAVEVKHEAQEELEIDLEDLEDEFIIDKEESESESELESDYGIANFIIMKVTVTVTVMLQ